MELKGQLDDLQHVEQRQIFELSLEPHGVFVSLSSRRYEPLRQELLD